MNQGSGEPQPCALIPPPRPLPPRADVLSNTILSPLRESTVGRAQAEQPAGVTKIQKVGLI